jgi:hypothetical protein
LIGIGAATVQATGKTQSTKLKGPRQKPPGRHLVEAHTQLWEHHNANTRHEKAIDSERLSAL